MNAAQSTEVEELWKRLFEKDREIGECNSRAAHEAINRRTTEDAMLKKIRKLKKRIARRDKWIAAMLFDRQGAAQ
jgi:hypothetical protein